MNAFFYEKSDLRFNDYINLPLRLVDCLSNQQAGI